MSERQVGGGGRRFIFALAATLAAAAAALSWSLSAKAALDGGTLRVTVNHAPGELNPLLHRFRSEYLLGELLYSGLTRLGEGTEVVPDLAESWSANDTLDEWTFKLRKGVLFHDGTPLTPQDVVASLSTVLDGKTGPTRLRIFGSIASVSALGDDAVVVKTIASYGDLPSALSHPTAKIVPAAIVTGDMDRLSREAIGTGPFKLVKYEPERLIEVERNPRYFVRGFPKVDRVEVVVTPDPVVEMASVISGETDIALEVLPDVFAKVSEARDVVGLRVPSGRFADVVMANDRKPFSDRRVREALSLSLDRQALVDSVAEGYGVPGNDNPVGPAYRYHYLARPKVANVVRARQLLAAAGYPSGLDLTLLVSDQPAYLQTLAASIAEMATAAGFRIKVQSVAHAVYLEQVWKQSYFYLGLNDMQATEDGLFSLLFTSDAAWNETRWNSSNLDILVERARATVDVAQRAQLYAQAQILTAKEVPALIPVFFDMLAAHRSYVEGYRLHPTGATFSLEKVVLGSGSPRR